MKNIISLIVDNEDIGQRIDSFINKNQEKLSRTRIKNLILKKKLKLNNKILDDPSKKVSAGDKIIFEIPEPEKVSLKPYDYKLDIVYEDENLIVKFTSGNKYVYQNVPRNKFLSWKYFDSFGKFFNSNIRNNYKFTKI